MEPISSLAGVVTAPAQPAGAGRTGGFGGADGLARYLRLERIDAVVDATHPFATTIAASARAAAAATGVPLLVLRRPPWTEEAGDTWRRVPSLAAAAQVVPGLGTRVLLAAGRRGLAAFAGVDRCWFLARCVQPPAPPLPARLQVLLDRGPFALDAERALLDRHRIDVVVTRNSGGVATVAKLTAARERKIPVVMVDRPAVPAAAETVQTVDAAYAWLTRLS